MMLTGKITKIKHKDGFGFIEGTDGTDRFFYKNAVVEGNFQHMREGDLVTFDHEENPPKGPRAVNVREALPGESRAGV